MHGEKEGLRTINKMLLILKSSIALFCLICSIYGLEVKNSQLPSPESPKAESPAKIEVITEKDEFKSPYEMPMVEIQPDAADETVVKLGNQETHYPLKFNMKLNYFNSTLRINMKMNTLMMSVNPKLISFDEKGNLIEQDDPDDCIYYQGYEASLPNSSSTMSVCSDGLEGVIMLDGKRLLLEPSKRHFAMKQMGQRFVFGPHLLKESNAAAHGTYKLDYVMKGINEKAEGRYRRENPMHMTETKYVEMYFVNDNREFKWLGSNIANNMKRMKQIANLMDSFYYPYNIRAILMGVEVWNDYDKMAMDLRAPQTLTNFMNYRNNVILPRFYHDCSLLVTRLDFDGPTIGLAPMGGMCHPKHSGNINQDTGTDFSLVTGTMTHEMGHNLGMDHDKDSCPCTERYLKCFMAPYAQDPIPTTFSECSTNDLNTYLRGDRARCLMNVPNLKNGLYIDDKTCGNNRLDAGEECDCGLPKWCKNPCCNPNTCKFTTGSQCARGGCCSNCKLQQKGTVCRSAYDQCDLEEKCDGDSQECPQNLHIRDGTACNAHSQDGYCKAGRCWSHNSQCQYAWGTGTRQADGACFDLNTRGDKYGNCGVSGNYYVRCSHGDRFCGQLHCIGRPASNNFPIVGFDRGRMSISFASGGRKVYCDIGLASLGRGEPNPCKLYRIEQDTSNSCLKIAKTIIEA